MDELIDQYETLIGSAPSSRDRTRVTPRWWEIARESWRNLLGGTTHAVRWSVILLALVGSLAWLEVSAVRLLVDDTASYITDGGATWILQAPQAINGNTCDSLARADGVLAAGALRGETVGLVTTVLPKAPIPLYSVTPHFPNLIGATSLTGVVVADQVVDRYALVTPTTIDTTLGPVAISGGYTMPSDSRSSIGFAALQPTYSDQIFDECWITIWPTNDSVKMLAYTALIPSENPQQMGAKLSQLNPTFASGVDPARQYDNRLTRWAPVAALVGGLVIGFAAIWTRRLELASALHAGLPKVFVLLQVIQETAAWCLASAILNLPVVAVAAYPSLADTSDIAQLGVRVIIVGCLAPLLGAVVSGLVVRERHLFRIFKNR